MAQAVSRRPVSAEARVRTQVSPCEICSGQSDIGRGFHTISSSFFLNIIPLGFSKLIYHVGGEQ
jgi:hypothetical protein